MSFDGKWLPDSEKYRQACLKAAEEIRLTGNSDFKRWPDYIQYVGNDVRPPRVVEAFDNVVKDEYVSLNDKIGNPKLHNGKSAGTLRYMKVAQDVEQLLGDDILDCSIVEIGGGYGGQAVIFNELFDWIFDYKILDIWEARELQYQYLNRLGITPNLCTVDEFTSLHTGDTLLLSDYCLSEFDEAGVRFYLERISARYCYVTCNSQGKQREMLLRCLSEQYDIEVTDEFPKTSHHPNILITGKAKR